MATILIDLSHPGDVHLFRRAGLAWQNQGHRVIYSSLDRETNAYLLKHYGLPHRMIWRRRPGKLALLAELLLRPWPLLRLIREVKADLVVSFGSMTAAFAAVAPGQADDHLHRYRACQPNSTCCSSRSRLSWPRRTSTGAISAPNTCATARYHELFYLAPRGVHPGLEGARTAWPGARDAVLCGALRRLGGAPTISARTG